MVIDIGRKPIVVNLLDDDDYAQFMTTERTIRPRPGSHIWRRTDGQFTNIGHVQSGAGFLEDFPGATEEERLAAELRQPETEYIAEGDVKHPVEQILNRMSAAFDDDPIVILGPDKPPFGEWEELDEWTPSLGREG